MKNATPEKDPRVEYADIIDLPHWQSKRHQHMSLYDRAAQFAPFAALSGYDDMITEEARETDVKNEHNLELLNQKLAVINDAISDGNYPTLSFSVFLPDEKKAGGRYETIGGTVKKIDAVEQNVILFDGKILPLENISSIRGEIVEYLDE